MIHLKNIIFLYLLLLFLNRASAKIGYFWHITDLHTDLSYHRYCRLQHERHHMSEDSSSNEQNRSKNPRMALYLCDSSFNLVTEAINEMAIIKSNPDFILWTGGNAPNDSLQSAEDTRQSISKVTDYLKDKFEDVPVLPVLGRNDFHQPSQAPTYENDMQTKLADIWKPWLQNRKIKFDSYNEFKHMGAYSGNIPNSNVSYIVLNTVLWSNENQLVHIRENDPAGQFEWIDRKIRNFASSGRKVILIGHAPPGSFERYYAKPGTHWYQKRFNDKYMQMIKKNYAHISAQFFGHHHKDSFRVFTKTVGNCTLPISYALIAPSVTPKRLNNPAIRLIAYDTVTGEIKEVYQYYLDLRRRFINDYNIEWQLEYNMTDAFQLDNINAESLYGAMEKMKTNRTFFDSVYPFNAVQMDDASACDARCHATQVCAITNIDYEQFDDCDAGAALRAPFIAIVLVFLANILHSYY